jgi:hypothetical protein
VTGNADNVAHIEQLEKTEGSLANGIELHVNLEPGPIALNMREASFPMKPQSQNAARRANFYGKSLKACGIILGVLGHDLSRRRGLLELMWVRIIAKRFDFGELFPALEVLVERLERQGGFPLCYSRSIPMGFSERQENACVKVPVISSHSPRRSGLEDATAHRGLRRTASVQEDWVAWLPEEKDRLFDATLNELEKSYRILSVTLDDAFNLCRQGKIAPAREQARMFAELFDRLAGLLRGVLRSLYEHSRQFGTFPNTAPLRRGFFRSERAQQVARANSLLAVIRFRARTRFFRKLGALEEIVAGLQRQARETARDIAEGVAVSWRKQWTQLEILDYDLNTSLRETTIVLKSFFCALPIEELPAFRQKVVSLTPKPSFSHNRRSIEILAKMDPALRKMPAETAPERPALTQTPRRNREHPTVLDNNK